MRADPGNPEGSTVTVPHGTVTFLFTDIEGSTRLLERLREAYADVLAEQRDVLSTAFTRWNGHAIDTQGDSFFVAFARATDAIACVVEAQRALAVHQWPDHVSVRVRMGLHTGEPLVARTGYVGMDVHRAARVAAAGHGGQVLLSQSTRELVFQDLPAETSLRDLGAHKLKDIRHPQQIFQLDIVGLPHEFPPLKTLTSEEEPPIPGELPFRGLQCFEEADAHLFFGRASISARLAEAVEARRFLAVVGSSGSGKSSVVRAGVIPALRRSQPDGWQIHLLTPTAHPLEALAVQLTRGTDSVSATATLMDDLRGESRALHLYACKRSASEKGHTDQRVLMVIDQFEELFTLCRSEAERVAFIDNLLQAASAPDGPVHVLITLRADFYEHVAEFPELRKAVSQSQEYLGAMDIAELRQAIEEPARLGGWEFSPGLVELMLHEVGADRGRQAEPGALPLLSHALLETWKHRRGNMMSLKAYAEAGGVRTAIARTAELLYQHELSPDQQKIARRIFLRLTELGNETSTGDTRRRATLDELILKPDESDTTRDVLRILADARLISTDRDSVEVAHEALIREWPTLRSWLEDNREGLRLHRQWTDAAQDWDGQNREPDLLYRGARLAQAREWATAHPDEVNQLEREFLAASLEIRERESAQREAQRERELETARKLADTEGKRAEEQLHNARLLRTRARYLTGALTVALLMAFAALFFGAQARRVATVAQTNQRIARARELAAAALNNLDVDPERSILLALQAVSTTRSVDGTVLPEAEEALHTSVVTSPIRLTLKGHDTPVLSAAYSPDGKHLATLGVDGTTIVWDASTGEQLLRLPGLTVPSGLVSGQRIAYSPDGKLLAACDSDQIKIYDLTVGKLRRSLTGHHGDVLAITMSADGKRIASGGLDGELRIWDVATGELLHAVAAHASYVEGIQFSPDGELLATSSDDATVKIWEVASAVLLRTFTEFPGLVDSVTFSPDGMKLAATSDGQVTVWQVGVESAEHGTTITTEELLTISDGGGVRFSPDGEQMAVISGAVNVRLLDSHTGRELRKFVGHTGWVMAITFSPDGSELATASLDGTGKIWSIETGRELVAATTTSAGFGTRITYSPSAQEFATNGVDGTAALWNASSGEVRLVLAGHDQEVLSVAFSPDGKQFATGSFDSSVIIWDSAAGRQLRTLSGHEDGVRDVAFSPDGKLLATGSFDGTARIWEATTGVELSRLAGHEGLVLGVVFSPDGTRLATSSTDTTARIWNLDTGEALQTLAGHAGAITDIAYSPDGTRIATGSGDATAKIWDANTGLELLSLAGHASELQSVAFSPDGKLLTTGSSDNTAKIWDAETGAEVLTLPGSGGGVSGVAFSPLDGGIHLLVASRDGVARVYLLALEDLLHLAESRVTRSLTLAECRRYLHTEECPLSPP
jgi:WD40 repeat protein/class 3 adenylate cyclase